MCTRACTRGVRDSASSATRLRAQPARAPPPAPAPAAKASTAAGASLAVASSLIFGAGLLVSGMCRPAAVQGFLAPLADGGWDPTLAFVMGSGVLINLAAVSWAARQVGPPPLPVDSDAAASSLAASPKVGAVEGNVEISSRLILGSAIFGAGWGLAGVCPGPAIVALGALQPSAIIFVPAMCAGMALVTALAPGGAASAALAAPAAGAPAPAVRAYSGATSAEAKAK